jgi:hypothetical protein
LNGWNPNTTSTVNNILGITFEDFDTNHVNNDTDANNKDRFVGLFESVDDIPNNEFKLLLSRQINPNCLIYQQAMSHQYQTLPYKMCLDSLCHSMTSLKMTLNILLGGWPFR